MKLDVENIQANIINHSHMICIAFQVPNSAILECQDFTTMDGKWFIDPDVEKRPGRRLLHKQ